MSAGTAILFFSLSPQADGARKRWCGGRVSNNRQLAGQLIGETERALLHASFPVFRFDERNQQGATFGERLANAFQQVFAMGFDQVICVGNDCLQISEVRWQEVAAMLQQRGAVLGPNRRGGAYLIGVTRERFEAESFAGLPWQTRQVWGALAALWPEAGVLAMRSDLNCVADIARERHTAHFAQLLWISFFESTHFATSFIVPFHQQMVGRWPNFRGPPWFAQYMCAAGDRAA